MVLLASVKVIMFSTVPLGAVIGCERARAGHTQQHCLQTPGRDDVTLQEHMFCAHLPVRVHASKEMASA